MENRWEFLAGHVRSIQTDPNSRETAVTTRGGTVVVMKGTRALRCPDPLPSGDDARILDATRVVTDEAAILTLSLESGDLVQVHGQSLAIRAA